MKSHFSSFAKKCTTKIVIFPWYIGRKRDSTDDPKMTLQARPYWHWMIKIQKSFQKDQFDFLGASLLALEQPGYAARTAEERLAGAFWTFALLDSSPESLWYCLSHWLCVGLVKEWLSENWGNVSNAKGNEWTRKSIIKAKIVEARDMLHPRLRMRRGG